MGKIYRIDKIIRVTTCAVMLSLLLYLLSPFYFFDWNPILINVEKVFVGALLSLALTGTLLLGRIIDHRSFQIRAGDILLLGYISFFLVHQLLIRPTPLDFLDGTEMLLLIALYFCFRNMPFKETAYIFALYILVFASITQIFFGISEQTNWFAAGYGLSHIKGNYVNQGPFAVSIACSSIILVHFLKAKRKGGYVKGLVLKLIPVLLIILFYKILIATKSRATWVALLMGLSFYFGKSYGGYRFFDKYVKSTKSRLVFITLLMSFLVYGILLLYSFKKESANGRLLIWNVTKELIMDAPFIGHGIGSFESKYMEYQADYFQQNKDSRFSLLASDNRYAFNEVLKLLSEQGIIGLGIVLVLAFTYYRAEANNTYLKGSSTLITVKSILLVLFIFGMFSYPSEVLQLKVVVCVSLAILSGNTIAIEVTGRKFREAFRSKRILDFSPPKYLWSVLLICMLITLGIEVNRHFFYYKEWNRALYSFMTDKNHEYLDFCKKTYSRLNNNGDFLVLYGISLSKEKKYKRSLEILGEASLLVPSSKVYIEMGKSYKNLKRYDDAENCWSTASLMVPSLFRPGYLTAKMYQDMGKQDEAIEIASRLLNRKVKVHSVEVHHIRKELQKIVSGTD
ncbi:MAG: O-antigen ligase family protein [Draconibacterium sp.]